MIVWIILLTLAAVVGAWFVWSMLPERPVPWHLTTNAFRQEIHPTGFYMVRAHISEATR